MGRLVWFGVVALSPFGAVAAIAAVAGVGALAGYALAQRKTHEQPDIPMDLSHYVVAEPFVGFAPPILTTFTPAA